MECNGPRDVGVGTGGGLGDGENSRLTDYAQWCAYRLRPDDRGKVRKPPVNPHTGRYADPTNPATWGTWDQARRCAGRYSLPGVGFMLTGADPFTVIDIDGCVVGGRLSPLAMDILLGLKLATYAEYSPSGSGVHIWCKTLAQPGGRPGGVEVYSAGQFMTWTGKGLESTPKRIAWVDLEWLTGPVAPPTNPPPVATPTMPTQPATPAEDARLWALVASRDKTGRVSKLYQGDLSPTNGDHSRAVFLLLRALACYVPIGRALAMMRGTGLQSDKWDRPIRAGAAQTWLEYQANTAYRSK